MKKGLLVGLAIALMASTSGFAHGHGPKHGSGFSAGTLNGTYLFEASGFGNDGSPGEVGVLGTLTFDGTSAVKGDLTLSLADTSLGDTCNDTFTNGSYTVTGTSAPADGTMILPMSSTATPPTDSLTFALEIPSQSGKGAAVLETDVTLSGVSICKESMRSLVLKRTSKTDSPGRARLIDA